MPNFVVLDKNRPDIAHLLAAMLQAREAVDRRSWSHPQESTGEDWWADVLADPRARTRRRRVGMAVKQAAYRLSDERRATILVECTKCDWKAAYGRDELIASHGAEYPLPSLLNELAKPGCTRLSNQWDHCGVHYVVRSTAEMTRARAEPFRLRISRLEFLRAPSILPLAEASSEPEMKVYLLRLALSWMQAATSADECVLEEA